MTKLTPKQQMFVDNYIIDLNATQAAIRAGYSEKTAQQVGSENLSKPVIKAEIQKKMCLRSKRTEITADQVIEGIAEIAFAEYSENINAHHKLKGFELLGKHLVMFTEKHVVEHLRPHKADSREELEADMLVRMERLGLMEKRTIN